LTAGERHDGAARFVFCAVELALSFAILTMFWRRVRRSKRGVYSTAHDGSRHMRPAFGMRAFSQFWRTPAQGRWFPLPIPSCVARLPTTSTQIRRSPSLVWRRAAHGDCGMRLAAQPGVHLPM